MDEHVRQSQQFKLQGEWFKLPMWALWRLCQIHDYEHPSQIANIHLEHEDNCSYDPRKGINL